MINLFKRVNEALDIIAEEIADKILEALGVETRVPCPVRVEVDYDDEV